MGQDLSLTFQTFARAGAAMGACLLLANCVSDKYASRIDPKYGVSASPRVVNFGEPVPKGGGVYRIGKPYVVAGKTYFPEEDKDYSEVGTASWYGADFHGRRTANGEVFDMTSITAAHPTMPIPSYARITNMRNGKSLIVRVNDRGPFHGNRLIDVSVRAAKLLEFHSKGLAKVRVDYVGRAPLEGSDDRMLLASLSDSAPAHLPGSRVRLASSKPGVSDQRIARLNRDVPVPGTRPYGLGQDEARVAIQQPAPPAEPDTDVEDAPARVASNAGVNMLAPTTLDAQAANFDQRFQPRLMASDATRTDLSASARPVAAYTSSGQSRDLLTGRGLY